MKFLNILRIVATIFIMITAALLILAVLGVVSSDTTKDFVLKLAAVCGVIAATSMLLSLIAGNNKA